MLDNTSVRVLYLDITVDNVIGQARFILLSTSVMLTNNTYLWPYKCENFVCHTIFRHYCRQCVS